MNIGAVLGRISIALRRTGEFTNIQISDILVIVEEILKEVEA